MVEDDRTIRMLERLKSQEKKPNPLTLSREISFTKREDPLRALAIEQAKFTRAFNELESYEKRMVEGKYLNYYHDIKQKQKEFLEITTNINPALETIAPMFYNRLIAKRKELLNKKL